MLNLKDDTVFGRLMSPNLALDSLDDVLDSAHLQDSDPGNFVHDVDLEDGPETTKLVELELPWTVSPSSHSPNWVVECLFSL